MGVEIISLSVDEGTLEKLERINKESSFTSRSEIIRKAISDLHDDTMEKKGFSGNLNAVIVTRHLHEQEHKLSDISHRFDDVIQTQLHSKIDDKKCLEIFHTSGTADRVIEFYNQLKGSKHTKSVSFAPQDR